jgi:hypothetical protein
VTNSQSNRILADLSGRSFLGARCSRVRFRPDENLSARADRKEVEANQLGAALLMPKSLVQGPGTNPKAQSGFGR